MKYDELLFKLMKIVESKNYSEKKLSGALDRDDSYINKVANKKMMLSIPTFLQILEILNVSLEEFFCEDAENYKIDKALLAELKSMPNDKKKSLLDFLKNSK